MRKKTHNEFISQLNAISPTIIVLGQYTGSKNHIEVQCSECGNTWNPTPHDLLDGKGCKSCKMKKFGERIKKKHSQFIEELSLVTTDIEVLGTYQSRHSPVNVKCLICKNEWSTTPGDLLSGYGCRKCADRKNGQAKRMPVDVFVQKVTQINPNIEFLENFSSTSKKIRIRCKACGRVWSPLAESLLQGKGCVNCKKKAAGYARRKSHEQFAQQVAELHPDIHLLSKYDSEANPIKVKCQRCGRIWDADPSMLLQGFGCSRCSRSATSFMEQFILQSFIYVLGEDKVISRDKETIGHELDIVIPSLKVAIEPGSWVFHEKIVERDRLKRNACADIGYRLFTVYDSYPTNESAPFSVDCFTVPFDLGQSDHSHIRALVYEICNAIGVDFSYTEDSWLYIEKAAYKNSKAKSTTEFIDEVSQINQEIEIIGQYRTVKSHIEARCKKCKYVWSPTAASLLRGEGCPICGRNRANQKTRKTHEQFIADMADKHPKIFVLGQYHNSKTPIEVYCSICGHNWSTKPNILLSGCGCPLCGRERTRQAVLGRKKLSV